MASEKTPNLGLNQIDRSSPKTTYFDLEKYLDQNWRAVDDFAGDVNDGVNAIKKRLDTTERKEVTLEPGVQIVHAEKAAPFSLTGLSGRTLVNLAGGDWGASKTLSRFGRFQSALNIDVTKSIVGGGSLKITSELANAIADGFGNTTTTIKAGRKYIALGNLYNEFATNMSIVIQGTSASSPWVTSKNKWEFTYVAFSTSVDVNNTQAMARLNVTAAGQVGYADALRLYEISDAEYTALANMTPEQIASKYPYVDSVTPVRNSYAIRYGENLAPHSFYSWDAKVGTPVIKDDQSVVVSSSNIMICSVYPLVPGQTYTVSAQSSGATGRIHVNTQNETAVIGNVTGSGLLSYTFTVPTGTKGVVIRLLGTSTADVSISDIMLNIGNTAKPFKPREDSMLALQTDLYADPVTGANADAVFERDGQYFKSKKWRSLVLDGSLNWVIGDTTSTGLRQVKVVGLVSSAVAASGWATKYDGKIIPQGSTGSTADTNAVTGAGDFYISVPVADSGWGDGYTPTADEIKAYFMGWTMGSGSGATFTQPYTSGEKRWRGIIGDTGPGNPVLPTSIYPISTGWTPYELVYQLATPTVEPIVSEGQLSFVEGDNQVEVGTGLVIREKAKLYHEADTKRWNLNNGSPGEYQASLTVHHIDRFIGIYKNSQRDNWILYPNTTTTAGAMAQLPGTSYDANAAYTVSYLAFITSPVVPFTGSYAANEKTLLLDLVDSVQQNTARVSVLENKKADKDSPGALNPTLLNGITVEASFSPVEYVRSPDGLVTFQGSVKPPSAGTFVMFRLPVGYRPKQLVALMCAGNTGTTDVSIKILVSENGNVQMESTVSLVWLRLDGIKFLANR